MKPEQFIMWLAGYLAAAEDKGLTDSQVKVILNRIEETLPDPPGRQPHAKC